MKLGFFYMIGAVVILLGSSSLAVAGPPEPSQGFNTWISDDGGDVPVPEKAAEAATDEPSSTASSAFALDDSYEHSYGAPWLTCGPVTPAYRQAVRFGWWGLATKGSPYGVGEWMGLDSSSPFWDVEGLSSDGVRTIDYYGFGPENQSTMAGVYYFGPTVSANLDYGRYLHRLGHDPVGGPALPNGFPPLGGFYDPPLPTGRPGYVMYGEDLNAGYDYALRVQQMDAHVKGDISENLSWRLNFWGMKKEGTRQANAVAHCQSPAPPPGGSRCHLTSQGQHVDWLTMEVEPVITARFDWLTLEYSRTMRKFQQDDQMLTYTNTRNTEGFGPTGTAVFFGYVPENYTEIDRLKVLADLGPDTDLYVLGNVGNTHNEFRESDRKFYGVDARLSNQSIDGLTLTAYGKSFVQNNSNDDMALNTRYPDEAAGWQESVSPVAGGFYLVDRTYSAVGFKSRWRPFYDRSGSISRMALVGGYEYRQIERDHVTYDLAGDDWTQPTTKTNDFFVGVQHDWSAMFSSFLRYRMLDSKDPLYGVTEGTDDVDAGLNSNQPTHEDRVEIGGNWNPSEDFMLTGSFWIQNSYSHAEYVRFDEDNYPIVISSWYAPDDRWSFTGGYATFSNWIRQDITLGAASDNLVVANPEYYTSPWNYTGRADVFNLGANYAWSENVTLTSGVEYVRSRNFFQDPAPSPLAVLNGNDYTDLPTYSAVRTNTWRLMAGTDIRLTANVNSYFRYNYYDWDDVQNGWNSGAAHMFLAGLSAVY